MFDDALIYIALNVLVIIAILRIARTVLTRRGIVTAPTPQAPRDYSTATCPLCGKYDATRPFISYAIDCHRKDCAS